MGAHVTTNLRLPKGEYEELTYRARRRRVSMASLVREAVAAYLGSDGPPASTLDADPVDALIGAFTGGSPDESVDHDHYLYGWPKESEREAAGRPNVSPEAGHIQDSCSQISF